MKGWAVVASLVALALGLSAWVGAERASGSYARSDASLAATEHSSGLILGGRLRCTATVASEVQAGQPVRVRFALRNRTKHSVTFGGSPVWLVVRAADGTAYDTETDPNVQSSVRSSGVHAVIRIRPGETTHFASAVPVRWKGPLQITPGCVKGLPAQTVQVTLPGPPSDANAAISEVVAASGHLLDQCRPHTPGVPVYGQIDSPGADAPPMSAQCSVSIGYQEGFWVAQAVVLTPPGVQGLRIWQPYETLWQPDAPPPALIPPYEEIAWEFVVTRDGATPVAAATTYATESFHQLAPLWYWSGGGWQFAGTGQCGGSSFIPSVGQGTTGPFVRFIGACRSRSRLP